MALLALAALYAAARVAAKDELQVDRTDCCLGKLYNGVGIEWSHNPASPGMALILSGSLLFLYYPRIQRITLLLLSMGMLGLPFSLPHPVGRLAWRRFHSVDIFIAGRPWVDDTGFLGTRFKTWQ